MTDRLTQVATAASKIKKCSKKALFDVICRSITGGALANVQTEVLAELYAYFTPPVPKVPKTREQWVSLAIGKKDVREHLNYLYSDGNTLVATDGRRLHSTPTDLPAGYYDTALNRVDITTRYPDIDRLSVPDSGGTAVVVDINAAIASYANGKHAYRINDRLAFDTKYLDNARWGLIVFTMHKCGSGAWRIDWDDRSFALVMPMP